MATKPKIEVVQEDLRALLERNISYSGWEGLTGSKTAFYVRGFTWYRDMVLGPSHFAVTDCDKYVDAMKERLRGRTSWHDNSFDWTESFGPRQFIDAASPNRHFTPKFHKAVEIIVLAEVIADDLHRRNPSIPDGNEIYEHLRIEPAVSFVHGFTRGVFEKLTSGEKHGLRQWTGQPSNDVFYEMGDKKTVTDKLAHRTRNFIEKNVTRIDLGEVDFKFVASRKYKPSPYERVDVKEGDLPPEARGAMPSIG